MIYAPAFQSDQVQAGSSGYGLLLCHLKAEAFAESCFVAEKTTIRYNKTSEKAGLVW